MRLAALALVAAALMAQDVPSEARFPVAGGELRYLYGRGSGPAAPLLVVLTGGADEAAIRAKFSQWQPLPASRGWNLVTPVLSGISDQAVKALESVVADAVKRLAADESRIYLAGAGAATAEVFYAVSRAPHLWAGAVAIQGSPAAAINSNRLYGANTQQAPLLWIAPAGDVDLVRPKLSAGEFHFEAKADVSEAGILDWLASQRRAAFPATVDCETGNPTFGRCYWIEMTKFDPKRRNDVLKSTRVPPGSGASLSIGPFGYDPLGEGPGVLVAWLPPSYQGPLKIGDRLVSLAGKEVRDGREYARMMDEITEEKQVAVVAQRGKERVRLESRIVLPKRDETITVRVQGRYSAEQKELLIISRAVTEMRVRIPAEWAPVSLSWNGIDQVKAESAGCWLLSIDKEPEKCAEIAEKLTGR